MNVTYAEVTAPSFLIIFFKKLPTVIKKFMDTSTFTETVATQSISSTPSLDLGGITLSLRIEHNNSEPSIHVEPYSPHQKLVRNISESEIETSANAKDFDDGIEVIRSYEMPVKERTTRSSAKRQV